MEAMVAVQFIMTVSMVREGPGQRADALGSGMGRLQQVIATSFHHGFRNRTVLMLLVATLMFGISLSGLELLWQPRVQSILGTAELSWVLGILAAGYFFSASAGYMLSSRVCGLFRDRYPLVVFTFRLLAGGFLLLLAFQDTILGFALFYFLILMTEGVAVHWMPPCTTPSFGRYDQPCFVRCWRCDRRHDRSWPRLPGRSVLIGGVDGGGRRPGRISSIPISSQAGAPRRLRVTGSRTADDHGSTPVPTRADRKGQRRRSKTRKEKAREHHRNDGHQLHATRPLPTM